MDNECCWAKHPFWYLLFCSRDAGHEGPHEARTRRGDPRIEWPNNGEGATIEDDHRKDLEAVAAFTRAEWDAAYQRALLLWHQIDAAKTGDAQKDVIARALLEFRRKDLEAL